MSIIERGESEIYPQGERYFLGQHLHNHMANALLTFAHGMFEDEATCLPCDEKLVELYKSGSLCADDFLEYMEARSIVIPEIIIWDDGNVDFVAEIIDK